MSITNGKTQPAPKPKAASKKSAAPLLDAALKDNPHKNGWDSQAALPLAAECANLTKANMSLMDFLQLADRYKSVAGWKNIIKATAKKYGVSAGRD